MKFHRLFSVSLLALFLAFSAVAADAPLKVSATFDLSAGSFKGTFFELMSKKSGIKAALDKDYDEAVEITSVSSFRKNASHFAHIEELEKKIKGGADGLDQVIAELAGKKIPVDKMYSAVVGQLRSNGLFAIANPQQQSRLAGALVPVIAIISGKGVLVQLDKETYCYNYGYAVGSGGSDLESDKMDRRTGRSYGASVERNAYDPTDNDYLRMLAEYTAHASYSELKKFYTTVFEILLKSDTSGIKSLNKAGQTVIADFMAIYMAELDRHLMTGLKMYEWENALTEITMLAAFSASDNGVTLDSRVGASNENERGLVESKELKIRERLTGFFGVGTDGSGLDGRNKQRRHALTRKIVAQQRKLNPSMVSAIEELIDAKAGADIYDELMEHINNFKTQAEVKKNADKLIDAVVEFVLKTRSSASEMEIL